MSNNASQSDLPKEESVPATEAPITEAAQEATSSTDSLPAANTRESTKAELLAGKFPESQTEIAEPSEEVATDGQETAIEEEAKDDIKDDDLFASTVNPSNVETRHVEIKVDNEEAESSKMSDVISNLSRRMKSRVSSFGEPLTSHQLEPVTHDEVVGNVDEKGHRKSTVEQAYTGIDPYQDDFSLAAWVNKKNELHQRHGFRIPPVAITYKNLTVYGDPVSKEYIPNVFHPVMDILYPQPIREMVRKHNHPEDIEYKNLIKSTSGFVLPGEMTLVLGRPGSGCSTFLRTLAGMVRGLSKVEGDILYNGIDQTEFNEHYSSYSAYNSEADLHHPTMTVRQTLRFVLECRLGGALEGKRHELIEEEIQVYLRTFGLLNCAETKVGDEVVRGCSGGEKKRVSICEQLCAGASLGFWDGSTRGLDSSTALDFIRSLKVLTELTQTSQVVSLYQASEDIFNLFDKVVLVDQAHVIYFGPVSQVKDYFLNLGFTCPTRKVTPDFLTGIAVHTERDVAEGKEKEVPNTIEEYHQCYLNSQIYKDMEDIRVKTDEAISNQNGNQLFKEIILKNKELLGKGYLAKSQYTTDFFEQFRACCKREWILAVNDMATIGALIFDVIMAIIVGGVFFKVNDDASGAFARGGAIFFGIMYSCFNALASVPLILRGRSIGAKHGSYKLYRTYLQPFCTQMTNVPFAIMTIIGWSSCNYFMVGLRTNASAFFTYMCFLFGANQAFGGIVRVIATASPDLNIATMANNIILLIFIIYAGYIIPYPSMHKWAFWIYWINPLGYTIKSMMQNEFEKVTIQCTGVLVPSGGSYDTMPAANRACAIVGAQPGATSVPGMDYLYAYMRAGTYGKWWNFMANIGFVFVIFILLLLVAKYVNYFPESYTINAWKKRRVQKYDDSVDPNQVGEKAMTIEIKNSSSFSWKHIDYTVTLQNGDKKQLLDDVSGFVKAGQLVALMGSSGAGKTTLIDSITQRKTVGDLSGQIYVGETPQGHDFKSITAYCEQLDVHNEMSTVREAIRFAAKLRQPREIPLEEKYAFAEQVIDLLELRPIADAIIGQADSKLGTSIEEKKRITIACELVAKPKILFLDEPTSGLDSQASYTIIRLLRRLADCGQAILCTIHQPSAVLFEQFDSLLLLARGGKTIYFGELGEDAIHLRSYFEKYGATPCPPTANVAEYMLEVIGAGTSGKRPDRDWIQTWLDSEEKKQMLQGVDEVRGCKDETAVTWTGTRYGNLTYNSTFLEQLTSVFARMVRTYWRNPSYNFGRIATQIAVGIWIGFSFFQVKNTTTGMQNRVFAIFMSTVIGALQLNLVQPNYIDRRRVFIREESSGVYDWKSFAFSITVSEWPWIIAGSTCFFVIFYFIVGLNGASPRAGYFWLSYCVFSLFCSSLGQAISAFLPTVQSCAIVNPIFLSMMMLLCGVTIPYGTMPSFWHWIYYADVFHYFIEGVIGNELHEMNVVCDEHEGYKFQAPSGQDCGTYMTSFFDQGGPGRLFQNDTDSCIYCPYKTGDQYLATLGWSASHKWRNYGIIFIYWVFNLACIGLLVKIYRTGR